MNGLIVVRKPFGLTSHDCVNKIRKIFNTKKVGHLGTLDPYATGVLVVCINEATKLVQFLEHDSKAYIATVCLGLSSDTYDLDGQIIEQLNLDYFDEVVIDQCLESFKGTSMQLPPIYSAIKKDGKKLYEYARSGQEVEISPREVNISKIERTSDIKINDHKVYFDFYCEVSKGTYIRSLCHDIGVKLHVPSLMSSLVRVRSGKFTIDDSSSLEEIEQGNFKLFDMNDCLDFPLLDDEDSIKKAKHGMKISKYVILNKFNELVDLIMVKENKKLLGVYKYDQNLDCYIVVRAWN